MFRKTAFAFTAIFFLFLIVTVLIFSVRGKFLSQKDKFSGKNNVHGAETSFGEQFVQRISNGNNQVSPVPSSSVQTSPVPSSGILPLLSPNQNDYEERQKTANDDLVAKMVGDIGFNGIFVPSIDNGWELKVLLVKEPSDRRMKTLEIQVSGGWIFSPGGEIKQKEVVGSGKANIYVGDQLQEIPVSIFNDQEIGGHVAHWKFYFGSIESPSEILDGYVDGDEKSGFNVSLSRSFIHVGKPQMRLAFSIYSIGDGGSAVFTGSGDFTGKIKAIIRFFDGSLVEIEN